MNEEVYDINCTIVKHLENTDNKIYLIEGSSGGKYFSCNYHYIFHAHELPEIVEICFEQYSFLALEKLLDCFEKSQVIGETHYSVQQLSLKQRASLLLLAYKSLI